METRYQRFTAYVECLFTNTFTKNAVLLFIISMAASLFGWTILAIPILIIAVLILILTGFGYNSYNFSKRAYKHMMEYEQYAKVETYCAHIGNQVAIKRIKKLHPEKHQAIEQKLRASAVFAFISIIVEEINSR